MFPALNLPTADLRLRTVKDQTQVFDCIRKKYLVLTPEEWVRQHIVHFLITEKNYPKGLIEIEKSITLFNTQKRIDILVRTPDLKPLLLIECKAPEIELTQQETNQLVRYQITLKAKYCMLTNGMQHFVLEFTNEKSTFLQDLPDYSKAK